MKTKEVVALMNISQDTLRYYEKVGVIPPVNRDENGYRIYNDNDLNWIYLVKNLRNAGVSIESLI
ncbi:TPA: MerR family transcriptional regulator, partial [Staphylococcus aureus]|nr:MerR family transcriptional regulator [Staphylococcus aureus]